MSKKVKNMYLNVITTNEKITEKNIKTLFIWYDLFGYALSFQIIFIYVCLQKINYATTMLSALFVILMDVILINVLNQNSKSYKTLEKKLSIIKLWTIPLLIIGITVTIILLIGK